MRPIRLELSAFGPYLEHTVIDFEKLNEAGLFLITGQTGGGKTTLLDAMSIALFYKSTGGRRTFQDMRCLAAADSDRTEVVYHFALGEDEYCFRRALYRRKKRGSDDFITEEENECKRRTADGWALARFGCGAQCDRLRGKPAFPHRRAIFAGHRAAAGQIHAASAREFYRKSSHFENAFLLRAMGTHRDEIYGAPKKAVRKARNVRDKTEIAARKAWRGDRRGARRANGSASIRMRTNRKSARRRERSTDSRTKAIHPCTAI